MNEIDARARYLAGVRELITWLEQNPTQPLPVSREFNVPVSTNSAVEEWAADNDMSDAVQYDKEGNASISLRFGPVTLHVYGYRDFAEHCDRNDGRNAREYAEKHGLVLVEAQAAPDVATEAFVEVADAERYALRDEYVNADDPERTTLAEQLRALGAEQAAQDAEADAFHAQRRADETEANGEYVDYDEAEAVREIREEMALEAAGVESWDQL